MTDCIERQIAFEQEACDMGAIRYRNEVQTAEEKGRADETAYGKQIISSYIDAFATVIEEYCTMTGRGMSRSLPRRKMRDVDPYYVAYRTISTLLASVYRGVGIASVSKMLGASMRGDMIAAAFRKQYPDYYERMIKQQTANTNSEKHIARVVKTKAAHMDVEYDGWSEDEAVEVAQAAVLLLIDKFDLFEVEERRHLKKTSVVRMSANLVDWVTRANGYLESLHPQQLPMVSPPLDWDETGVGGYYTYGLQARTPFVRGLRGDTPATPQQEVFDAVNAVQATPWRVNKNVLLVQQAFFGLGGGKVLPEYEPVEFLPSPTAGIPTELLTEVQQQQLNDWKQYKKAAIERENKRRGKALQSVRIMRLAERYVSEPEVYFPHNVDFRGRVYPIPEALTPQGNDQAKGLLEFAASAPLGTHEAAKALAIHGTGVFGYDKDSLDGRYDWLIEHEELVLQCAADPMGFDWWTEADKPWQFLAFCYEWAGYKEEGLSYETRLACAYDGSCNGLQHFSAALLDETGGEAVNLLPATKPNDIYGVVAGVARTKLCDIAAGQGEPKARQGKADVDFKQALTSGPPRKEGELGVAVAGTVLTEPQIADLLLAIGIDRKVTKRPVMIVPYNGTKNAVRSYLVDSMVEKGADEELGTDLFKCMTVLTNVVWEAIGEVVVAARGAMEWIAESTRTIMLETETPHVEWTTPAGFTVRQVYNNYDSIQVQTMIREHKIRKKVSYAEPNDKPSLKKHKQSTSPNWVHSMDASMLMQTVTRCVEEGVVDFAMIHDSYGVRAPDAPVLNRVLRQAFVDMYQVSPLETLKAEWEERYGVALEPLPPTGNLELEEVLNSDYFFA